MGFYKVEKGRILISVRAIPKGGAGRIEGVKDGALRIRLKSAPEDGKANKELITLLAEALETRKDELELLRGETSRSKTVAAPLRCAEELKRIEESLG
jgi:uncharacterized protein (TIGR00251 family)